MTDRAAEGIVERGAAQLLADLEKRYTADVVPPCRVCGGTLSIQAAGAGPTVWACDGLEDDPDNPGRVRKVAGRGVADEHYSRSRWTQYRDGDSDVLDLISRHREAASEITRLREVMDEDMPREVVSGLRVQIPSVMLICPDKTDEPHLRWMLDEVLAGRVVGSKAHRWLGFVQGVLAARGHLHVDTERARTRPLFDAAEGVKATAKESWELRGGFDKDYPCNKPGTIECALSACQTIKRCQYATPQEGSR